VTLKYKDGSTGTAASAIYDHHIVFMDLNKRPVPIFKCPNAKVVASPHVTVFAGAGEDGGLTDFTMQNDQLDTGYYVWPGDRIFFAGELVNYPKNTKEVYAEIYMEYITRKIKLEVTAES
jgi:hypothetical protein